MLTSQTRTGKSVLNLIENMNPEFVDQLDLERIEKRIESERLANRRECLSCIYYNAADLLSCAINPYRPEQSPCPDFQGYEVTQGNRMPVSRAEVYWYLKNTGKANCNNIALGIGLAKSTVSKHALALQRAGILFSCKRHGKQKEYGIVFMPEQDKQLLEQLIELEPLVRHAWRLRGNSCG